MNYKELSKRFVESRPKRTKSRNDGLEVHHILPTSLGGKNVVENKIALTPREHFVAHLMLIKCFDGAEKAKMVYAIHRMASSVHKKKYRISSRSYEVIRNYYKSFNRERTTNLWQNEDYRKLQKEMAIKRWQDPGYRLRQGTTQLRQERSRKNWQDPLKRARLIAGLKQYWANKRQCLERS